MRLVAEHFNQRGKPKAQFPTAKDAMLTAQRAGKKVYECSVCGQFHIGGRHTWRSGLRPAGWLQATSQDIQRCKASRRYKNESAATQASRHRPGSVPSGCRVCGCWHLERGQ